MKIFNKHNQVVFEQDTMKEADVFFNTEDIRIAEHGLMLPVLSESEDLYTSLKDVVDEVGNQKCWLLMDTEKTATFLEVNLMNNQSFNIDLLVCCFPSILAKKQQEWFLNSFVGDIDSKKAMQKFLKQSEKFDEVDTFETIKLNIELTEDEKADLSWELLKSVSVNWLNEIVDKCKKTNDFTDMPVIIQ